MQRPMGSLTIKWPSISIKWGKRAVQDAQSEGFDYDPQKSQASKTISVSDLNLTPS